MPYQIRRGPLFFAGFKQRLFGPTADRRRRTGMKGDMAAPSRGNPSIRKVYCQVPEPMRPIPASTFCARVKAANPLLPMARGGEIQSVMLGVFLGGYLCKLGILGGYFPYISDDFYGFLRIDSIFVYRASGLESVLFRRWGSVVVDTCFQSH